ncbi:MAG: hypothetical protein H8E55_49250 [Pelagibacterales bacterium]|nr:hypothetical protein [Pelagibacterales bacterium]
MDLLIFKFDKPWYRQTELLEKLSMSNACLKRYMSEQLKGGGTLSDMGYLKFEGFKEACWCPNKFCAWLIENKLEKEPEYNYDKLEQQKLRMGIVNFNNKQQKKASI